jgi:hypothetical protein
MMAILFLLYLTSLGLILYSKRKEALFVVVITVVLCLAMLMHHATDVLKIRL